jgi:opacity protein-like surface antigen
VSTSILAVTIAVVSPAAQAADPIQITGGTLVGDLDGGVIDISGERGFTMRAGGATQAGVFDPAHCAELCEPGPLGIRARWSGSDLGGTVTIDGQSYDIGIGTETSGSAVVEFDGSIRLPSLGQSDETLTVSAPFTFAGTFAYPATSTAPPSELLVGKGTATLTFVRNHELGTWSFQSAIYEFHK